MIVTYIYITVRSLSPICISLTSTMFSEPILRQNHTARQRQKRQIFCLIARAKLIDSVVTDNTSSPCSARWTEVCSGKTGINAWSQLL